MVLDLVDVGVPRRRDGAPVASGAFRCLSSLLLSDTVDFNRIQVRCSEFGGTCQAPPYDSRRRRAQANETRSAIVRTARDLFIEQGYGHTTVADIARAAGVSVETIYAAFGNKATLLHKAWDITVGGDDQDIVFHERPRYWPSATSPTSPGG